jgi:DNA-binding transcriptional LysR family regulator
LGALTAGRDYGVLSGRTWRLADLGAKQSMLLAGLGWGNMPAHLVEADIAQDPFIVWDGLFRWFQSQDVVRLEDYRSPEELARIKTVILDRLRVK